VRKRILNSSKQGSQQSGRLSEEYRRRTFLITSMYKRVIPFTIKVSFSDNSIKGFLFFKCLKLKKNCITFDSSHEFKRN
jgi:hypothetical protein